MPPFGFPAMYGYGMPQPSFWDSPIRHSGTNKRVTSSRYNDARSSSPIGPDVELSAEEFCEHANLPHDWVPRLENLGFNISADLDELSREDWSSAGFRPLETIRVKKALKQVLRDLKK